MSPLNAFYFDGKRALRHEVSLLFSRNTLKVVGREVSLELDVRRVRVAPRIAATPRWLYLPGGGACVVADNDAVDRISRERGFARFLHKLEARPAFAAIAVVLVVAVMWLLFDQGVPAAAERISAAIPRGAESVLGEQTFAGMERTWLKPSELLPARREALRSKFDAMARAAGEVPAPRLEFRASPTIGPNAFALPGGIVLVTDELVRLSRRDEEVLSVLAHELGHVRYRHTLRQLLQGSATALVIAGVTGDIASTTSLAASAPVLLLQTKYSRDYEREADRFAIDLLKKVGIAPQHFARFLKRSETKAGKRSFVPTFLSSHPPTEEREALALAGAAGAKDEKDDGEGKEAAAELTAARVPAVRPLALIDPGQRRIAELLGKREYAELERLLGGLQLEFERESASVKALEDAFRTFRKIPLGAEGDLNEWVRQSPSSYAARVARGGFYMNQGLDARGENWASETSDERIQAMRQYMAKATGDLERSLEFTSKPYLSHRLLMSVSLYAGSRDTTKARFVEAAKLAPRSAQLRLTYMISLEPRWGGSLAEMEAFVAESKSALETSDVNRLAATIPAYRGFESSRAKDYEKALTYFDESLGLDEDAGTLCERSYALSTLKRDREAFNDVVRALAKERDHRYCMKRAVFLSAQITDTAEAVKILNLVIEVDPNYAGAYSTRGWAHQHLGQPERAFSDYLAAAKLGDAWGQLMTGKSYWSGRGVAQDREQGLAWLEKSAAQGHKDAQYNLSEARRELARK